MFETGNDVIDHTESIKQLSDYAAIRIFEGDTHRFENLEAVKEEIISYNNRGVLD